MSAPQPPDDRAPQQDPGPAVPSDSTENDAAASDTRTFDFHGEKLDFDPYRFGAPEPATPTWGAPQPAAGEPGRPPEPGDRWMPGGGDPNTDVRPGDYWQGGGSQPQGGAVFPPPGYRPPPTGGNDRVDLGKPSTGAPVGYPPPSYPGYHQPGGYPGPTGPSEADRWRAGNKIAMWGFGVSLLGCALFFTSFIAVLIGGTGLGLSIAGLVKARKGAPHKLFALWGIGLGIVAVAAGIALLVWALSQYDLSCIANLNGDTGRINECVR